MDTATRTTPGTPALLALVAGALLVGVLAVVGAWALFAPADTSATSPVGASTGPPEDGWKPWDRNDDGSPVRWDPCSPVELVVDPDGAYPGFERDLAEAIDDVAAASDLRIEVVGEVSERPSAGRGLYQPDRYGERWAPVLVAFAEPEEHGLPMLDTDRALAVPVAVGPAGDRVYVTGQIVLNIERDDLVPGSEDRATSWGATLRHELGHLLGLDHVDDEAQLMHRFPGEGPVELGDGDRRGLRALGAGGCLEEPEPQHLEVQLREAD